MIRPTIAAAAAVLLIAAPVAAKPAAAPAGMEAAFSNTIVSTYPDGRKAKLWLNRDGTYRGQGRRGGASSGTWKVKGKQVCLKQSKPFPAPMSYCTAIVTGGVGASWSGKAVSGEKIRIQLVAGR